MFTRKMIERYASWLKASGLSPLTVYIYSNIISRYRTIDLTREGILDLAGRIANFAPKTRSVIITAFKHFLSLFAPELVQYLPRVKKVRTMREKRVLSYEEFQKLVKEADKESRSYGTLLWVHLQTLARPREILGVKGSDITRRNGTVYVHINTLKGGIVREVPVYYRAEDLLKLAEKAGSKRIWDHTTSWYQWRFARWCRRAGIKNASPHTLRHTGATWLMNAGVPIATIKYMGGWRSSDVLINTYLHSRKNIDWHHIILQLHDKRRFIPWRG